MKVWVVHRDVMYEGGDTLHICSNRRRATALALDVMKDDKFNYVLKRDDDRRTEWEYHDYTVTVHDVEVKE